LFACQVFQHPDNVLFCTELADSIRNPMSDLHRLDAEKKQDPPAKQQETKPDKPGSEAQDKPAAKPDTPNAEELTKKGYATPRRR
jgi:hypothetical protein